ncbi:hypothetical protein NTE_02542 [Candidatus Nitrososphaera evergladensis SR1]|uniref:Uncharacterized protein n=1 Tax=Candidatus Nitrososphaera evergladensis SR1 TaxID=1459636 RepID=A0A075MZB1_9ARCH|nr:hypothetical protein [Candidatus Nitrososphaera evergladensis]AIF84589.1 hypothetical protein NTE_02542 [Candidatus Nitrososphaera evergladensis SR1]
MDTIKDNVNCTVYLNHHFAKTIDTYLDSFKSLRFDVKQTRASAIKHMAASYSSIFNLDNMALLKKYDELQRTTAIGKSSKDLYSELKQEANNAVKEKLTNAINNLSQRAGKFATFEALDSLRNRR